MAEETRARVRAVIAELGFVRNESARRLRQGPEHTRAFGVVVEDLANPFFADVAQGAERAMNAAGMDAIWCTSEGSSAKEQRCLDLLEEHRAAGVIIMPLGIGADAVARLRSRHLAVVLLDRDGLAFDACSVRVDHLAGGDTAVSHLLAQGHDRLAFVTATHQPQPCHDRRDGAVRALARHQSHPRLNAPYGPPHDPPEATHPARADARAAAQSNARDPAQEDARATTPNKPRPPNTHSDAQPDGGAPANTRADANGNRWVDPHGGASGTRAGLRGGAQTIARGKLGSPHGGAALDSAQGGANERAPGGADTSAPRGIDESARGGADQGARGGIDESARGGADQGAPGSVGERAPGAANQGARGDMDESTRGGADRGASGSVGESAAGSVGESASGGVGEGGRGGLGGGGRGGAGGGAGADGGGGARAGVDGEVQVGPGGGGRADGRGGVVPAEAFGGVRVSGLGGWAEGWAHHLGDVRGGWVDEGGEAMRRADASLVTLVQRAMTPTAGRLAARRLLELDPVPTGVFCANDLLAIGVVNELLRRGVRVPEEIAVVGYDDIELAAVAAVALTTVRQPRQELGRVAAGLALAELDAAALALEGDGEGHVHRHIVLTPELVVRESA